METKERKDISPGREVMYTQIITQRIRKLIDTFLKEL
jgi:hypothetical protein